MTRQPGHLNGAKNKNFRGSNENWRTGSTCVGFSSLAILLLFYFGNLLLLVGVNSRLLFLGMTGFSLADISFQLRYFAPEK